MEGRSASASILVVEDDGVQRLWLTDVLETEGFAVLTVANGEAALETLQQSETARTPVRAVITDIQMPGAINGIDLVRRIREAWPHIELVVVSGYHQVVETMPPEVRVLRKPVDESLLLAVVQHIMRGRD